MSQQPQTIVVHTVGQSTLGTAGLIFSILGWVTCGMLCIPGAALSFLGLFSNKQKTHALIGLLIGFPGVLFFFLIGLGFMLSLLGLAGGAAAQAAKAQAEVARQQAAQAAALQNPEQEPTAEPTAEPATIPPTEQPTVIASQPETSPQPVAEIEQPKMEPKIEVPAVVPAPEPAEPASPYRTFVDITGKYKIVAELIAVKNNWVKLKKDDGKEITMPIEKLSEADQIWVKANQP